MNGTMSSAVRAMAVMPPKMMTAESAATTMPVTSLGAPKAPSMASAIELACTALKTRPKERIRQTENSAPAQGAPRPREM